MSHLQTGQAISAITTESELRSSGAGIDANRRRFLYFTAASAAALLLPPFISNSNASVATPAFRISLAGDLLQAFKDYLDYDRGQCNTHASYHGKVTIDRTAYQIEINTHLCQRRGISENILSGNENLYFDNLVKLAAITEDKSLLVRLRSV